MGFRFNRRIRILPGIRVNIGKKGTSTSFGARGAWLTVGRRGTRVTVGLPGTGLSYTKSAQPATQPALSAPLPGAAGPPRRIRLWRYGVVLLAGIWAVIHRWS
jgi:hypothetical protein